MDSRFEQAKRTTRILRQTFFENEIGRQAFRIVLDILKFGQPLEPRDVPLHNAALELLRLCGAHDPANAEYWQAASHAWVSELKEWCDGE